MAVAGQRGRIPAARWRTTSLVSAAPVWPGLLLVPVVVSGLVDIPRVLQLGSVSVLGLLTTLYCVFGWVLWIVQPVAGRRAPAALLPLLLFFGWALIGFAWHGPTQRGAQNLGTVGSFVGLAFLAFRVSQSGYPIGNPLRKALVVAGGVAFALYALRLILDVAGEPPSSRAFALFALLVIAAYLAYWRYGMRWGLWGALIGTALVGMSLSRIALGVALALFPLSQLPSRGIVGWLRVAAVGALMLGLAQVAIDNVEPLRQRFFEGDLSMQVGELAINAEGRTTMWNLTLDSIQESPWVGQGPGSVEEMLTSWGGNFEHPHNDYLRIWHDYGIVGLGFWLLGFVWILRDCWSAWSVADRQRAANASLYLAAILACVAVSAAMVTDNPIVYIHVMAPLGVLVGTALGARPKT